MSSTSSAPTDVIRWDTIELCPICRLASLRAWSAGTTSASGRWRFYCSDGRWGEAFDEFCQKHLLIPRYDRWAVPGGPAWLAAPEDGGDFYQAAREQIDFLVQAHQLQRIVLITHFGCAYYGQRLGTDGRGCLPTQTADVQTARAILHQWYPEIRTEAYLAMRHGHLISFHRLDG